MQDAAPRKFTDIDAYIAAAAPALRPRLSLIRDAVKLAVPGAAETISYNLPAFRTTRVFFYFAAFKAHIGIYPPLAADTDLAAELAPYRGPGGNLKLPLTLAISTELICPLAAALCAQYCGTQPAPR